MAMSKAMASIYTSAQTAFDTMHGPDVDRSQMLHLRRVNDRWLFTGQNVLMGPTDIQLGVTSTRVMTSTKSVALNRVVSVSDAGARGASAPRKSSVGCGPDPGTLHHRREHLLHTERLRLERWRGWSGAQPERDVRLPIRAGPTDAVDRP
jgi:hypothetical protein